MLIMGLPGAGKSTLARTFVARGYERLNRDESGGSLRELLPAIDGLLASGRTRIVLDNTYVTRKARTPVIQAARKRGLSIRCVWLSTSLEDAQVNAAGRIAAKYGRLLGREEMRELAKRDVHAFGPSVQFRYQRELEPPDASEGFTDIEIVPFERRPRWFIHDSSADCVVRRRAAAQPFGRSLTDLGRRCGGDRCTCGGSCVVMRTMAGAFSGCRGNPRSQPGHSTVEAVEAIFDRLQRDLGVPIEVTFCPHGGGPPTCWCRKPLPGLGIALIQRHQLDASQSVYVGSGPQDPGFARRLGFKYVEASEFFARDDG